MLSEPSGARGTVAPLARLSPRGKLRVLVDGAVVGVLVRARYPAALWLVTVRLTVTAVAPAGTPEPTAPAMTRRRAVPALNLPPRPRPVRVSSRRVGPR